MKRHMASWVVETGRKALMILVALLLAGWSFLLLPQEKASASNAATVAEMTSDDVEGIIQGEYVYGHTITASVELTSQYTGPLTLDGVIAGLDFAWYEHDGSDFVNIQEGRTLDLTLNGNWENRSILAKAFKAGQERIEGLPFFICQFYGAVIQPLNLANAGTLSIIPVTSQTIEPGTKVGLGMTKDASLTAINSVSEIFSRCDVVWIIDGQEYPDETGHTFTIPDKCSVIGTSLTARLVPKTDYATVLTGSLTSVESTIAGTPFNLANAGTLTIVPEESETIDPGVTVSVGLEMSAAAAAEFEDEWDILERCQIVWKIDGVEYEGEGSWFIVPEDQSVEGKSLTATIVPGEERGACLTGSLTSAASTISVVTPTPTPEPEPTPTPEPTPVPEPEPTPVVPEVIPAVEPETTPKETEKEDESSAAPIVVGAVAAVAVGGGVAGAIIAGGAGAAAAGAATAGAAGAAAGAAGAASAAGAAGAGAAGAGAGAAGAGAGAAGAGTGAAGAGAGAAGAGTGAAGAGTGAAGAGTGAAGAGTGAGTAGAGAGTGAGTAGAGAGTGTTAAEGAVAGKGIGIAEAKIALKAAKIAAFRNIMAPQNIAFCVGGLAAAAGIVKGLNSRPLIKANPVSSNDINDMLDDPEKLKNYQMVVLTATNDEELAQAKETIARIKEINPNVKVNILSHYNEEGDAMRDKLNVMRGEKEILSFASDTASIDDVHIRFILPLYKDLAIGDNALDSVGIIADVFGIPGLSTALSAFETGRSVKADIKDKNIDAKKASTTAYNISDIMGFNEVDAVAAFINTIV